MSGFGQFLAQILSTDSGFLAQIGVKIKLWAFCSTHGHSLDVVKGGQNQKKRMILDWMNLLLQDSACIGRYHSDSKGDWLAVKSMIGLLKNGSILTRFAQN